MIICERRAARSGLAIAIGTLLTATAPRAMAQAEENQAAARSLLLDARKLMKDGAYDKACPKLEAASKLYPGSGLLLNLGDCLEHQDRLASAWTVFGEAAATAHAQQLHPADEVEAKRRQAALEPRLQRIAVHVTAAPASLVVKRDGTVVDRGAWDTALPVDSGAHTVTAEAPGRVAWTTNVTVTQPGQSLTVPVPELLLAPVEVTVAAPPPVKPSYWTSRRIAGVVVLGAGVVGVGIGGAFGLTAKSEFSTAESESGAAQRSDSASAVKGGDIATAAMIGGGIVAAVGLVVWLTAPDGAVTVGTTGRQVLARWDF